MLSQNQIFIYGSKQYFCLLQWRPIIGIAGIVLPHKSVLVISLTEPQVPGLDETGVEVGISAHRHINHLALALFVEPEMSDGGRTRRRGLHRPFGAGRFLQDFLWHNPRVGPEGAHEIDSHIDEIEIVAEGADHAQKLKREREERVLVFTFTFEVDSLN